MDDDGRLLRRFAEKGSEEAFALLTKRHLGLVYAVCRRELDTNEAAEDAAQAVFLLLAQKAKTLRAGPSLAGWLFQTARLVARNARTQAARRAHYEGKAAAMQTPPDDNDGWADIEPLLNSSLAALPARDREGVLLRFFQGRTFAEMGAVLGLSEEAARKRVGRALEKLRRSFDREGVTLPSTVLPALLTAHATPPVPLRLAASAAHISFGTPSAAALTLTQGVHHAMKIARLKLAAGSAALFVVGAATYAVVRAAPTQPIGEPISLDAPINAGPTGLNAPGPKDAVRNVVLTGKIRYVDGRPAGGVEIDAQIQNQAMLARDEAAEKRRRKGVVITASGAGVGVQPITVYTQQEKDESWNNAVSQPDGTYTLPVGAGIPYNVMVYDTTGKWVAAAIEGASGAQNSTVKLSDLVLTQGAIVTGTVTDAGGRPLSGVDVGSYGPHRPASSAAIISTKTNGMGKYRLRIAPGVSRVYIATGTTTSKEADKTVTVAAGEIQTVDLTQ